MAQLTPTQQEAHEALFGPDRKDKLVAIDLKREELRLKGLIDMGLANDNEREIYRRITQTSVVAIQTDPAQNGVVTPDIMTIHVHQETFERGWSSGGSTPPEAAGILSGVCDVLEPSRTDIGTYFAWFHSKEAESGESGYWRGALTIDKVTDADGRGGKLKDLLLALGIGYRLERGQVSFVNPKGAVADCDWQMVEIKGQKQLRIQGVYPSGERKQSV